MPSIFLIGLENVLAATLIAAVVAVLSPWLRRRPAVAHVLWLLVLVKLVTPPLWFWSVPEWPKSKPVEAPVVAPDIVEEFEYIEVPAALAPILTEKPAPVVRAPFRPSVGSMLASFWIFGSVVTLAVSARRIARFRRLLALAEPASDETKALVSRCAERLGMRRGVRVLMIDATIPPLVWSWGRSARLVLPVDLWKRLDAAKRETVVAHELAHLARGDDRVRWLEQAVTILYWWLPVVWWARAALREAEEQCCDAWVVWGLPGARRAYAETLIDTVDFLGSAATGQAVPASASGFGRVHNLNRRVAMLMQGKTQRRLSWSGRLFALAASAVLLPIVPTWAQQAEKAPEIDTTAVIVKDMKDLKPFLVDEDHVRKAEVVLSDADDIIRFTQKDAGQDAASRALKEAAARLKKQLDEAKSTADGKTPDEAPRARCKRLWRAWKRPPRLKCGLRSAFLSRAATEYLQRTPQIQTPSRKWLQLGLRRLQRNTHDPAKPGQETTTLDAYRRITERLAALDQEDAARNAPPVVIWSRPWYRKLNRRSLQRTPGRRKMASRNGPGSSSGASTPTITPIST